MLAHLGKGSKSEGQADGVEAKHLHTVDDMRQITALRICAARQVANHGPSVPHNSALSANLPAAASLALQVILLNNPNPDAGLLCKQVHCNLLFGSCQLQGTSQEMVVIGVSTARTCCLLLMPKDGALWPYTELKPNTERPLRMISLPCSSTRVGPLGPGPVDSASAGLSAAWSRAGAGACNSHGSINQK